MAKAPSSEQQSQRAKAFLISPGLACVCATHLRIDRLSIFQVLYLRIMPIFQMSETHDALSPFQARSRNSRNGFWG